MRKIIAILLILTLILTGCGNNSQPNSTEPGNNSVSEGTTGNGGESSNADPIEVDFSKTDADMFTERDKKAEYDVSKAVTIQLNGSSATASSNSVQINGSTVIIKEEASKIVVKKDGFDWYIRINGDPDKPLHCKLEGKRRSTTKVVVTQDFSPALDSSTTGCYQRI